MKVMTSVFLDSLSEKIEEQIGYAKKLDMQFISLRSVNNKRIWELTKEEVEEIKNAIRKAKIKIIEIEALLNSYNCNDSNSNSDACQKLERTIEIANELNVLNIIIEIPKHSSTTEDLQHVIKIVNEYGKIAYKSRKKLLLARTSDDTTESFTYIVNRVKYKDIGVLFDPKLITELNESATTNYRVLKNNIFSVRIADIDSDGNNQLIGYGETNILDLFKRMIRDNYNKYITLDMDFNDVVKEVNKVTVPKEKRGIMRIFGSSNMKINKKNEKYFLFKKRMLVNQEEEINSFDVIANQIDVLKKVFN